MKLIKLKKDHYVIVDDSEITVGDFYLRYNQKIMKCTEMKLSFNESLKKEEVIILSNGCGDPYERSRSYLKKITHSTEPIEIYEKDPQWQMWDKVTGLNLSDIKEVIGEVDVINKAMKFSNDPFEGAFDDNKYHIGKEIGYIAGYNQSIEDNKEKKYTEEHLIWAIQEAYADGRDEADDVLYQQVEGSVKTILNYLKPKTEWEVEFINGKLRLK
jgi:hypothetical protein